MAILKLEPYSGISGDMFLGALAPLANAEETIINLPRILGLQDEATVEFYDLDKNSILCRKANVIDHNAEKQQHDLDHGHAHAHSHDHGHDHHHHHGPLQRGLNDIRKIIQSADLLTDRAKSLALEIFQHLGEAEASVHGMPIEQVHFHEVGAIDSIIDIVGAAVLIDELDITQTYSDPICTGFGFCMTDHGRLPVPAPATERLLHGIPTVKGSVEAEMTTPTGAAIIKVLNPVFEPAQLISTASNFGAGSKDFEHPNALRASLCQPASAPAGNDLVLIQTNLDDLPGEQLGNDFQEQLFNLGALDVFLTPIIMKKGRPGIKFEVLCRAHERERFADVILECTSTLGVRFIAVDRKILPRNEKTVTTSFGPIRLKVATLPSGKTRSIPEYEDCRKAAQNAGVPVNEVYLAALKMA